MPAGPGKYDEQSHRVMAETGAETVIVVVIGGIKGNGFSVHSADPEAHNKLPATLRLMADQIEASTS